MPPPGISGFSPAAVRDSTLPPRSGMALFVFVGTGAAVFFRCGARWMPPAATAAHPLDQPAPAAPQRTPSLCSLHNQPLPYYPLCSDPKSTDFTNAAAMISNTRLEPLFNVRQLWFSAV